jgi:hypothetical protein
MWKRISTLKLAPLQLTPPAGTLARATSFGSGAGSAKVELARARRMVDWKSMMKLDAGWSEYIEEAGK